MVGGRLRAGEVARGRYGGGGVQTRAAHPRPDITVVTMSIMSSSAVEPTVPPADEATVRVRADELRALAAQYGVSDLRFASPGRLVGRVEEDGDALDTADFEIAARALIRAELGLFPDRVLSKPHVSPDLVAARPL